MVLLSFTGATARPRTPEKSAEMKNKTKDERKVGGFYLGFTRYFSDIRRFKGISLTLRSLAWVSLVNTGCNGVIMGVVFPN